MAVALAAGKLRNLKALTDDRGRFTMMAIDQRGSLLSALGKVLGRPAADIGYEELAATKEVITRVLSPYASAVLTDPEYGIPASAKAIPGHVGLLVACEATGYDRAGANGKERLSKLVPGWSAEKTARCGANAVKLLVYYNPDASEDTRRHQQELVRRVGEDAVRWGLAFLLELVSYPLAEPSADSSEFARRKPELVARSAQEFSKPEYQVDVLKLEFPANLKFAREYCRGVFDRMDREPVYALDQVRDYCRRVNEAAALPWVILSAGVDIAEFLVEVELATAAGASGFLCGRAIWKNAVSFYPDLGAMEANLSTEGVYNFVRCNAAAQMALPWHCHQRFGGLGNVEVANAGPGWAQAF